MKFCNCSLVLPLARLGSYYLTEPTFCYTAKFYDRRVVREQNKASQSSYDKKETALRALLISSLYISLFAPFTIKHKVKISRNRCDAWALKFRYQSHVFWRSFVVPLSSFIIRTDLRWTTEMSNDQFPQRDGRTGLTDVWPVHPKTITWGILIEPGQRIAICTGTRYSTLRTS